jgi:hypothetical protein
MTQLSSSYSARRRWTFPASEQEDAVRSVTDRSVVTAESVDELVGSCVGDELGPRRTARLQLDPRAM